MKWKKFLLLINTLNSQCSYIATPIALRQPQVSPPPQQTSVIESVIDKLELSGEEKKKEFITIPTGDGQEDTRSRSPTIRPKSQNGKYFFSFILC